MTRSIRVASCSGSSSDRIDGLQRLAKNHANDPLDGIIGDWMSESNMVSRGVEKTSGANSNAYEHGFVRSLEPALGDLARNNIKLVVNAGASDTQKLYRVVTDLIQEQRLHLKVAWISGDEVLHIVKQRLRDEPSSFENIYTKEKLTDWAFKPLYAQAYLGAYGITAALSAGADIVLCGRVSDASLLVGLVTWWHSWRRDQFDCLANSLIAGHLIECSSYVCGGNFSGFRRFNTSDWTNLGYPIAEISSAGQVVISRAEGFGGELSIDTATAQLLYELQGPLYFNSDVVADITKVKLEQLAPNRIAVDGVQGHPPPATTKLGITAHAGYQAEILWFIVGLDVNEKAAMMEAQIRHVLARSMDKFSVLEFTLNGTSAENPSTQNSATVGLRVFAQTLDKNVLEPENFLNPIIGLFMTGYPGATPHMDFRLGLPKPVYEYFVTKLPQDAIRHEANLPWNPKSTAKILIEPPTLTKVYPARQPNNPNTSPAIATTPRATGGIHDAAAGWAELPASHGRSVLRETFGPWGRTIRGPLGWIVHARSGDKGSDANVGFWVQGTDKDRWDWLRSLLSTRKLRDLLGEEYVLSRKRNANGQNSTNVEEWIERFEFPGIRAVHFLLKQHLDRGVSSTRTYDFLGKNTAEFLRARYVDLPVRFLEKEKL